MTWLKLAGSNRGGLMNPVILVLLAVLAGSSAAAGSATPRWMKEQARLQAEYRERKSGSQPQQAQGSDGSNSEGHQPSTIRVGVVGAGANTKRFHIPNLQKLAGVQVLAVANRSPASTAAAAAEFGITHQAATWREVVENPALDAVVIGTWPYMHKEITMAALAAGKHVLCEARMAMDATEAAQMLAAARSSPQLVTQLVPSPMTLRWDKTISRLLREGALGTLLHVDMRGIGGKPPDTNSPMHWRNSFELSGVNTMTLGIYYEAR